MADQQEREITEALAALSRGAPEAMDRLMPLVYRELKRIAHRQLKAEAGGHTLSTTAVVHEAYLRLAGQSRAEFVDRGQFFALAARAMRRVLIDYARQHHAARRGGPARSAVALEFLERGNSPALSAPQRADVLLRLPDLEHRAGRIHQHGHPAQVEDLERRCQNLCAEFLRALY